MATMGTKDNLAVQVVEKLKGTSNFSNWKFCMQLILEERGLLSLVTGELAQPGERATDQEKKAYADKNRRALIVLASNVEASQLSYIKPHELAKDAWTELCGVYQKTAVANQLFLRGKFRDLKQKDGEGMQDFITRVRDVALELEGAGATISEEEMVLKLLEGVLPKYEMFVTALEAQVGELKFMEVTAKLLHEELRRHNGGADKEDAAYISKVNKPVKSCYHCGKPGHLKKDCYKWKRQQRERQQQPSNKQHRPHGHQQGNDHNHYANSASDNFVFQATTVRVPVRRRHGTWTQELPNTSASAKMLLAS